MNCAHDRVVRLEVAGEDHWICNWCNAEFVLKARVDYKIRHLTRELDRLVAEGTVRYEQAAGVWREEGI